MALTARPRASGWPGAAMMMISSSKNGVTRRSRRRHGASMSPSSTRRASTPPITPSLLSSATSIFTSGNRALKPTSTPGRKYCVTVVLAPSRSRPETLPPCALSRRVIASSMAATLRACSCNSTPAGVSVTPEEERRKSAVRKFSSSSLMCCVTAGWEMCSPRAARLMLCSCATRLKTRRR